MSDSLKTQVPSAPPPARAPQAWKWWLAIVLFLATVLTYLDRQTMSLCAPMITKEFQLSNEQYGQLVAAFRWAYALLHIPAGYLADRVPIRLVYALAVGLWSLAGTAGAVVWGFRQLLITRAVLGVGEAFNWPCATRIVANVLPPSDRGLGSGIFNSGAAVGSLIAPLIITPKVLTLRGRTVRKARGTTLALATLLIVPVSLVTWLGSPYACIALMGLAGRGITSIVANYTACMQDFSFKNVGIVAGINGMASNVTAALANPYIGRYVDHTGNYTLIFVLMAVLPAVSLGAILLFDTLISKPRPANL